MRELDLSWNTLGLLEEGVSYIASALASNSYLETLVLTNCQLGHDAGRALAGGGLRDNTRIASGDPQLWRQILEQNSDEVLRAIDGFEQQLHTLKTALLNQDSPSVISQLQRGKTYRDQL